jgi:hypothetical protein
VAIPAKLSASPRQFITPSACDCAAARRRRRLMTRVGAAGGDRFVAAVQVMNTAIATNWHVAAAHTKA